MTEKQLDKAIRTILTDTCVNDMSNSPHYYNMPVKIDLCIRKLFLMKDTTSNEAAIIREALRMLTEEGEVSFD